MRTVCCDGSPDSVAALLTALAAALDGGPAVLPYHGPEPPPPGLPEPAAGTALVIETSGSTGIAKRALLTADALRASAGATHTRLGGPGRWLLALPAHHVAGAQVLVRGLLAGHSPIALDSREGFSPERFAAAAAELTATAGDTRRYTSLVPTQLHRVLATGGAALDALRTFDAVLVGGAATSPMLLEATRAAGVRVVTSYGMSETAGGCVYDGVPLDGVQVRLDKPDGRISLAGPVLASGYLGQPELTAKAFVDGWFRTSDLGIWDGGRHGRLRVLGRADDVIVTGGEKVQPAAVERVLTEQPGVRAACVVGLADPEWGQLVAAAVVLDTEADQPEAAQHRELGSARHDELESAVRTKLGAPSVPRLIRAVDELPLRGVGKPDRAEVARLLTSCPQGADTRARC